MTVPRFTITLPYSAAYVRIQSERIVEASFYGLRRLRCISATKKRRWTGTKRFLRSRMTFTDQWCRQSSVCRIGLSLQIWYQSITESQSMPQSHVPNRRTVGIIACFVWSASRDRQHDTSAWMRQQLLNAHYSESRNPWLRRVRADSWCPSALTPAESALYKWATGADRSILVRPSIIADRWVVFCFSPNILCRLF